MRIVFVLVYLHIVAGQHVNGLISLNGRTYPFHELVFRPAPLSDIPERQKEDDASVR